MCEHVADVDDSCGCIEIAEHMSEEREEEEEFNDPEETGLRSSGTGFLRKLFIE